MSQEWTHEKVVQKLAGEMFRGAIWAALATVAIGAVVWTVVAGVPGLVSALIGGALAIACSLITLWLMHRTANLPVQFIMIAAFGGFLGKLILLVVVMVLLRKVPALAESTHENALALTMAATIVVATFMEVRASKRSRSQVIIPTPGNP